MLIRFTPLAEADLTEIALYIAQDNPERALSFVDELEAQCQKLGRSPMIGSPRPELAKDLRVWPHGRYLIFYRVDATRITIVRMLHGSRDIVDDDFL